MANSFWPDWQTNKIFSVLAALVLGAAFVWIAVVIRSDLRQFDYIGQSPEYKHEITVTGEGKIVAVPDIAVTSVGIRTEKKDVLTAQKENTEKMNKLISDLKKLGIDSKDLKTTSYSIYPEYDYLPDRGQVLKGYTVNQSLEVKIRDLDKIGDALSIAAAGGANEVSGVSFTIDDEELYKKQAREKALASAKEKADALAKIAGVKLGRITSFSESAYSPFETVYRDYAEAKGIGGGVTAPAPTIEKGSMEISITATISYEIL